MGETFNRKIIENVAMQQICCVIGNHMFSDVPEKGGDHTI